MYAYVNNSPVTVTDPLGLDPDTGIGGSDSGSGSGSSCGYTICITVSGTPPDKSPNAGIPHISGFQQFLLSSSTRLTAQLNQARSVLNQPRVRLALKGLGNLASGAGKTVAAAGAGLAAPESGGLTIPLAIYTGIGAAGNYAAGFTQLAGAITGNVQDASNAADAAGAATTVSGAYTLATTGDVGKAANAAAAEGFFTAGFTGGATGNILGESALERVGTTVDFTQNAQQLLSPPNNQ
jgi:hypothetical protein